MLSTACGADGASDNTLELNLLPQHTGPIVIGLLGSSNATGRGNDPPSIPIDDPTILMVRGSGAAMAIEQAQDPIGLDSHAMYSAANAMAQELRSLGVENDLVLINAGRSAATADNWIPGAAGRYYSDFIKRVELALALAPDARVGLIHVMQGEANSDTAEAVEAFRADWPVIFDALATDLAGRFVDDDARFSFSRICASAPIGTKWAAFWEDTRAATTAMPDQVPGLAVVDNDDGPWTDGDPGLHLQTPALRGTGARVSAGWARKNRALRVP